MEAPFQRRDRYLRQSLLDWLDEDRVRAQSIVVVGAGAIGNEVLKNLALLGVGELHIFDGDRIEAHNLTRAVLFRESDLGRPKAICAAERVRELEPSLRAYGYVGDFWDTLGFDRLRSATGVFGCVDNYEARVRLNRLCALAARPWINTGIDSRFAVAERVGAPPAACYECALPADAYSAMARRYSCGGLRRVAREERIVPTTILTSSLAAGLAVSLHFRALAGPAAAESTRVLIDTFDGRSTVTGWPRRPGCPGCGDLRDPRVVFTARAALNSGEAAPGPASSGLDVRLSEPVVTGVRCRTCAPDQESTRMLSRAGALDERLADCPRCGPGTREVAVRDRFTLNELFSLGPELPVKFVICDLPDVQVVLELEMSHERSEPDHPDGRPHPEGGGDGRAGADRS